MLEEEDYEEKDNCTIYGFLSKTRKEEITENISEEQLIKIILEKNPDKLEHNILSDVLKTIKSIDTNKNGYVSYLELTNCFKNHYETELFGKSLSKILKPF